MSESKVTWRVWMAYKGALEKQREDFQFSDNPQTLQLTKSGLTNVIYFSFFIILLLYCKWVNIFRIRLRLWGRCQDTTNKARLSIKIGGI